MSQNFQNFINSFEQNFDQKNQNFDKTFDALNLLFFIKNSYFFSKIFIIKGVTPGMYLHYSGPKD